MRNVFLFIMVSGLLIFAACGGSSDPTGGLTIDELFTQADTQLKAGNISGAKESYTTIIESAAASSMVVKATATESEAVKARFGRALCNILLIPEQDAMTDILAGFGQGAWDNDDIFGETGYLAVSTDTDDFDYSVIPFNNLRPCWTPYKSKSRNLRCLAAKIVDDYDANDVKTSLDLLITHIGLVISDLTYVAAESDFTYTLPKEMYNGDVDFTFNYIDAKMILSSMYLTKGGYLLAASYTDNFALDNIVDENGVTISTKGEFVDMLNEFFAYQSTNDLAEARSALNSVFYNAYSGIYYLLNDGTDNEGILNLNGDNETLYNDFLEMAYSGYASFSESTSISQILKPMLLSLMSGVELGQLKVIGSR
jgi:hypothetical protein